MRALISVHDKRGLIPFARGLAEQDIEIISTGGTARLLKEAGVPVTPIELVTGVPEMLGGRVKTLHPKIHGGILARRHVEQDEADLHRQGIVKIELVVVNLYPFEETIARAGTTLEEAIEQIDIGGVALLRAAAKNHTDVTVIADPADYDEVLRQLRAGGRVDSPTRTRLAVRAFRATAAYDAAIAAYLGGRLDPARFPERLILTASKVEEMRYGENPHQRAALYRTTDAGGLANAKQLHGKGMSYTNWLDAEGAWAAVQPFDRPAVVIVKHASPCGIATNESLARAWRGALASDPVSAFGGVVALNRPLDIETARAIDEIFTEIVLAPDFDDEALTLLSKKRNRRLLRVPPLTGSDLEVRGLPGGFVVQERDAAEAEPTLHSATPRDPTDDELAALRFAWRAVVGVKSNAIVLARAVEGGFATVGIGTGQPSRVDAVALAVQKAGHKARGAVLASDAFFPFADGLELALDAGISAIVQPGGSVRDDELIAAAAARDAAMVFTGVRHFKH